MKANMGSTDRILRILVAVIILGLYFAEVINGLTATILLVVATIFILTSIIRVCPAYMPFGLSTCKKES